jgi:hypothetical protein
LDDFDKNFSIIDDCMREIVESKESEEQRRVVGLGFGVE